MVRPSSKSLTLRSTLATEAAPFNSATDGWSATPRTPLSISPRRSAHRELILPQHSKEMFHDPCTARFSSGQLIRPNLPIRAVSFDPTGESSASNRPAVSLDSTRKLHPSGRFAISFHPAREPDSTGKRPPSIRNAEVAQSLECVYAQ